MRIIVIGDIHGRSVWREILEKEEFDFVVFLGDYFDSFDHTAAEQIHNFKEIIAYKMANNHKCILLIGNHDAQYMPRSFDPYIEGFNMEHHASIQQVLVENKTRMQMAIQLDNFLFTHAGVSETFLRNTQYPHDDGRWENIPQHLNILWKMSPEVFKFVPGDRYGNTPDNGCTWIRPGALMAFNKKLKKSGLVQVVGHTRQDQIDIKGKATGKRYFFVDTLEVGQYLIIENGVCSIGHCTPSSILKKKKSKKKKKINEKKQFVKTQRTTPPR